MNNTSAFLINRQYLFTCLGLTDSSCELPSQILCFDPHLVFMNKTGPGNASFIYEPLEKFHSSWIMQTPKLTEAYMYVCWCVFLFKIFFLFLFTFFPQVLWTFPVENPKTKLSHWIVLTNQKFQNMERADTDSLEMLSYLLIFKHTMRIESVKILLLQKKKISTHSFL